ncbi:MAG: matrixin family metalloprotease [Deltaproteobacteria bacterium]|nr:matrixin family metalloprotease [Deltaproteobacteria bacterium]
MISIPFTARAYTLKTTSIGSQIRWSTDTISIRYDKRLEAILDDESINAAAVMASEAWRGFDNVPDMLINHGEPYATGYVSDKPSNGLYLADPWPYESQKLAVTVTTYEESTGRLLDADVLINPDVCFAMLCECDKRHRRQAYDFVSIITHEFGHVLGLGESYDDPMATMWPQIATDETHKRTIEQDDEMGVLAAYSGEPPDEAAGCGKMSVSRGRTRPHLVLITAAFALLLCLAFRARDVARRNLYIIVLACGSLLCIGTSIREKQMHSDFRKKAQMAPLPQITPLLAINPEAIQKLSRLTAGSKERFVGRIDKIATENLNGLFWTSVTVHSEKGDKVQLRVPGGTIDGITQQVGDDLPVKRNQRLLLVRRSDGGFRWSRYGDSAIY